MGEVKPPPTSFSGEVDTSRGSPPSKKSRFFGPNQKPLSTPPNFEETIALAFLKATYPQIPHWVHFTFKVQNPIYIFTSIE